MVPLICLLYPERKQAYSAEVGVGASGMAVARGVTLYRKLKRMECRVKVIICRVKEISLSRGSGYFRERGRGNDTRYHQLRFCKTEINGRSGEIESVYQSKSESQLIADKGDEEGVCYFLKSTLPSSQGTANEKKII